MTTDDRNHSGDHLDDHPGGDLDDRLHRLLAERAAGVSATADISQVMAAADRPLPSTNRSRLFYVGSVAAAVVAVLAGIGVVGLVGDEPAVREPTNQRVEPSTMSTTSTTGSTLSSTTTVSSTTVSSTTTEQQPADCPPGQLPVEDGCRPPSTTTTTTGVSTSTAASVVTSVVTSSTTTMSSTTVDG